MRRPVIAGNWKMYKTAPEAEALTREILAGLEPEPSAEVILCPPLVNLATVRSVIGNTLVGLGAQNMHWESEGAYTGEVSGPMLLTAGCTHVILGHSERRTLFGETDETVNRKVLSARASGLIPILCVGETLAEREGGRAEAVVVRQVRAALTDVPVSAPGELMVAYEPVWAIGTGRVAEPEDAQAMHEVVHGTLARVLGSELAAEVRVQYGGSVKPDNAARLLAQRDIDGALVGGASLDAGSFLDIVRCMDS